MYNNIYMLKFTVHFIWRCVHKTCHEHEEVFLAKLALFEMFLLLQLDINEDNNLCHDNLTLSKTE